MNFSQGKVLFIPLQATVDGKEERSDNSARTQAGLPTAIGCHVSVVYSLRSLSALDKIQNEGDAEGHLGQETLFMGSS